MPSQRQIRGTTQATQEARTLVSRELDINTTDGRLAVHDGSTAGGIPHINFRDHQNQEYTYAVATGTNAIGITLAKAPAAYAGGQAFSFKAAATITGSATLNVNGLGAKTLKKKNVNGGSLDVLAAGDIIIGGIYTASYAGTDMILNSVDSGGLAAVSQGDLNTSTGAFSGTPATTQGSYDTQVWTTTTTIILPGGEYGFFPQSKNCASSIGQNSPFKTEFSGFLTANTTSSYVTGVLAIGVEHAGSLGGVISGQQRYVTASPPFDMGDGEVGGFIFFLMNKDGSVAASYRADVPPWGYNGPTNIRADKIDKKTGKKYRRALKAQSLDDVLDGGIIEYEYQEITQAIKNADMGLIPHPFGNVGADQTVVLLDPMDTQLAKLIEAQNAGFGDEIDDKFERGFIKPDNTALVRQGPAGVMQVALQFK